MLSFRTNQQSDKKSPPHLIMSASGVITCYHTCNRWTPPPPPPPPPPTHTHTHTHTHKRPAMWKPFPFHGIISITNYNYHLLPIHIQYIRDRVHYHMVIILAYSYLARWYQRLAIGFVIWVIVTYKYTICEVRMSIYNTDHKESIQQKF